MDLVLTPAAPHPSMPTVLPMYAKPFPDVSNIKVFDGHNFNRWKDRVFSLLDMHGVAAALTTSKPETNSESWEYANKVCRHTILSTLSNSLFVVYVVHKEAHYIWESMTAKYTAEDFVKQKFVCSTYYRWEMTEDKEIVVQIHEYQKLLENLKNNNIN